MTAKPTDWIFTGAFVRVVRETPGTTLEPWTGHVVHVERIYGDYIECSRQPSPSQAPRRCRMYLRSMLEAATRDEKAEQIVRDCIDPVGLRVCGVPEAMPSAQEHGAVVLRVFVRVPAELIDFSPLCFNKEAPSRGEAPMEGDFETTLILRCLGCSAEHDAQAKYPNPPDVPGMMSQNTEIGRNCSACGQYGYHKIIGERAKHSSTIVELRSEAKALYATLRATAARLAAHESTEGVERELGKFRETLTRLGAL